VTCSAGTTTTAPDGSYSIMDVPAGAYSISATAPGYRFSPKTLTATGADVSNLDFTAIVPTSLSKPAVSPSKPTSTRSIVVSTLLTPGITSDGTVTLYLLHSETKTVTKKVHGKKKKVKVTYWRQRVSDTLHIATGSSASAGWRVTGTYKLAKGAWQTYATYSGAQGFDPSTSPVTGFKVK
jgi:hypothetical protein